MLIIRTTQMGALEEVLQAPAYEAEMLRYLQAQHSVATAGRSDATMLARIRELSARARSYGAPDVLACGEFVELTMSLGDGFDREPWAASILRDAGASARAWNDKVSALVHAAPLPAPFAG